MNRRSMFKATIGACAAMLFPWRRAKARPLWAYFVDWKLGEGNNGGADQAQRIERLVEAACRHDEKALRRLCESCDIVMYEATVIYAVHSPPLGPVTTVRWASRFNTAFVSIKDSVAASMSDVALSSKLTSAFLTALHEKRAVWIEEKPTGPEKLMFSKGPNPIAIEKGKFNKTLGESKT